MMKLRNYRKNILKHINQLGDGRFDVHACGRCGHEIHRYLEEQPSEDEVAKMVISIEEEICLSCCEGLS